MGKRNNSGGGKGGGKAKAMKYLIKADLKVNGNVQRKDIIGAIMGQTEACSVKNWSLENFSVQPELATSMLK